MQQVNIIGKKYVHVFRRSDGVLIEQETDAADYFQLGQPNPVNPSLPDCVWLNSHERQLFDTPSGDIEDDQYAVMEMYVVKTTGYKPLAIEGAIIKNNTLEQSAKDMIEKPFRVDEQKIKVKK